MAVVHIDADLGRFLRRIDDLSDVASDEAREIARAFDRGLSGISSTTSRVTTRASADFSGLGMVAEKALKKMGAAGGEVADVLFDFAGPLGEITSGLGAAGVAATALGGAVIGVGVVAGVTAAAVVGIVNAAEAARDRLTEAGLAAQIPESAQVSLDRYHEATQRLQSSTDLLVITLADQGGLIDGLTGVVIVTERLVGALPGLIDDLGALADAGGRVASVLGPIASLINPVLGGFLNVTSAGHATATAFTVLGSQSHELSTSLASVLDHAGQNRFEVLETGLNRVTNAARAQVPVVAKINDQFVTSSEVLEAIAKALPKVQGEVDGLTVSFEAMGAKIDPMVQTLKNATAEELAALRDVAVGITNQALEGVEAITSSIVDQYERRAAAGEVLSAKEKRTANALAIAAKAAAITQLGINAVLYWFELTRDLALIPGNAAGAPFEAAAFVATSMIAPAVQVLGEPIPFPGAGKSQSAAPSERPDDMGPAELHQGYSGAYGANNVSPGASHRSISARSSSSTDEVAITVVFPGGRVGKRRVY